MDVRELIREAVEEMPPWVRENMKWWGEKTLNYVYGLTEEMLRPEQPEGIALARKTMENEIEEATRCERVTGIKEIKKMVWGELNHIWPTEKEDIFKISINGIELTAFNHLWCALPAVVVKMVEPKKKIFALYFDKKGYLNPIFKVFYPLTLEQLTHAYGDTIKCYAKLVEIRNATCDLALTKKCLEGVCEHADHLTRSVWERLLPNMVTGQNYPDCISIIGYSAGLTDAIRENCPPDEPEIAKLLEKITSGYMSDEIREVLKLAREEEL